MTEIRSEWNDRNSGAPPGGDVERHRYGFAQLDAIGAIFNEITVTALGLPGNRMPANAPVSYPFIWDTPQHDRVQWNGSVQNAGAGALGRNVGEVLGVFGSIRLNTNRIKLVGHETSVDIPNLGALEGLLWKLQSPLWPETILPEIDRSQATQGNGREAFERFCLECHADIRRDDPDREIKAVLTPVDELRTDPAMAANFANRVNESGRLKRRFKTYIGFPGVSDRFEEKGAGVEFLGYGVIGAITRQFLLDPLVTVEAIKAGRPSTRERVLKDVEEILEADPTTVAKLKVLDKIIETLRPAPTGLVYKGRPLNGIWATAPYLHNGSVRTMRQLLLPASERQTTFRVGSREYDPHDMGFEDAGGYPFDTTVAGNSNAGHEGIRYGSETFKNDPNLLDALLEYLKTL